MEKDLVNNKNYEEKIEKMANTLKNDLDLLKIFLRSHDELVKNELLPSQKDSMEKYPYWCYCFVLSNK